MSICSGLATGCSIATRSPRSAASRARASANSRDFMRLRRSSTRVRGRAHADIGGEQRGLDLVEQVVVELGIAREQAAEAAREHAAAQALAPAGLARGRRAGRRTRSVVSTQPAAAAGSGRARRPRLASRSARPRQMRRGIGAAAMLGAGGRARGRRGRRLAGCGGGARGSGGDGGQRHRLLGGRPPARASAGCRQLGPARSAAEPPRAAPSGMPRPVPRRCNGVLMGRRASCGGKN